MQQGGLISLIWPIIPQISLQYPALFCIQPRSLGGVFDALINYQQQKRHYPQAGSLKLSSVEPDDAAMATLLGMGGEQEALGE